MYAYAMEASILHLFLHLVRRIFVVSQLSSTNGPEQAPPSVPHTGGAKSYAASD